MSEITMTLHDRIAGLQESIRRDQAKLAAYELVLAEETTEDPHKQVPAPIHPNPQDPEFLASLDREEKQFKKGERLNTNSYIIELLRVTPGGLSTPAIKQKLIEAGRMTSSSNLVSSAVYALRRRKLIRTLSNGIHKLTTLGESAPLALDNGKGRQLKIPPQRTGLVNGAAAH